MAAEQIESKVGMCLADLGLQEAGDVHKLFGDLRQFFDDQYWPVRQAGATGSEERDRIAKEFRDYWLSRKNGILARIDDHWLKAAPKDWKREVGREFNVFRQYVEPLIEELPSAIRLFPQATKPIAGEITDRSVALSDLTLPGYHRPLGSIHPVTRAQREIEDIFLGLGFVIETGPEIESVYYNFDALNIPESHPARDDWDTIYVDSETVLRTHTSPVQMRAMEKHGAPLYVIAPGKCYRRDNPDSTHSPMFHQLEGLAVDTDITFADLRGTLDFFAKKFFGEKVRTRFTPSFFPFTEPSGEVAVSCPFCDGKGCRRCKGSGWIELLGCGMVHPEVLRHGGIDPDRYSGWAFGLGIDRFAMVNYDVNDIQLLFQGDVRFLQQF
jgi:phenylalanyl-tRNA synthetase alpha chain